MTDKRTSNSVAARAREFRDRRGNWGTHSEALCAEVERLQRIIDNAQSASPAIEWNAELEPGMGFAFTMGGQFGPALSGRRFTLQPLDKESIEALRAYKVAVTKGTVQPGERVLRPGSTGPTSTLNEDLVGSEQWYDEKIAPMLLDLSAACKARGISFSATVEYAPGEYGETQAFVDTAGLRMHMLGILNYHGENVDGFVMDLLRYCRKHNIDWSQSVVLRNLGGT